MIFMTFPSFTQQKENVVSQWWRREGRQLDGLWQSIEPVDGSRRRQAFSAQNANHFRRVLQTLLDFLPFPSSLRFHRS